MGKLASIIALLAPLAIALLLLGIYLKIDAMKLLAYAIFFVMFICIMFFIALPLFILSLGLAYRRVRWIARKNWEESKYMLIALLCQVIVAWVSIFVQNASWMEFWHMIGLFILNSALLLNLFGECYTYTAIADSDAGIGAFLLGATAYGVYVINLLEKLGWLL